jgi:hypothetical protein
MPAEGIGRVRITTGLGFAGIGVAVGAAAVAVPASAASAGTTYHSTATAIAGYVSVGGNQVPVPDNTVTATDGDSPQSASLGLDDLESALPASPLGSSVRMTVPSGANLVTETATAQSDGMSSACAGFLAGDCASGGPQPITISLGLADLPGLNVPSASNASSGSSPSGSSSPGSSSSLGSALSGLVPSGLLPSGQPAGGSSSSSRSSGSSHSSGSGSGSNPLAGYQIVLTLSGPEAACTAGPPGSSGANFTATQSLASASLDILDNGSSILPGGSPIKLSTGNILSQIPMPSQLSQLLGGLPSLPASPLNLTINPGSTSGVGSGPVTTATAGELGLSVNGTQVLSVVGAKATCGPDNAVAGATSTKTSSEVPLGGGIQTDEGRSGSSDTALWLGVAGGAALAAGGAGGLTVWRRRRS